jgi:hypothetical protein
MRCEECMAALVCIEQSLFPRFIVSTWMITIIVVHCEDIFLPARDCTGKRPLLSMKFLCVCYSYPHIDYVVVVGVDSTVGKVSVSMEIGAAVVGATAISGPFTY